MASIVTKVKLFI